MYYYNTILCYIRDEWQYLVDRFSLNDRGFGKLIPSVCAQFNTHERLEEVNVTYS